MPYVYQCPIDGCDFTTEDSQREFIVNIVQEHYSDTHDDTPEREEIVEFITGSGQP